MCGPSTAPRPSCRHEVRDKGDTLLKQVKRQVVTVGANDAQLDDVLKQMRRGERARVAFDDKTPERGAPPVRAERAIAPRRSPWAPLIQGACRSKRVALGASTQRPRWGDAVDGEGRRRGVAARGIGRRP